MLTSTWYKSQYWTGDETGIVGGAIDLDEPLSGLLDEVLPLGRSKFIGRPEYERFCKVFFRNEGNAVSDLVFFFADQEHPGQVKLAFEKDTDDTGLTPTGMPDGYTSDDFIEPIGLTDTEDQSGFSLANNESVGIWLWERIPDGLNSETGAISRIVAAGDVL